MIAMSRFNVYSAKGEVGRLMSVLKSAKNPIVGAIDGQPSNRVQSPPEREHLKFAEVSDVDLLGYMSLAEDDPAGARGAGTQFFLRHAGWLFLRIRGWGPVSFLGGEPSGVVSDIVQETIAKAYKRAATFKLGRVKVENMEAAVRGWLSGIAWRVCLDMLADRNKEIKALETVKTWEEVEAETRESTSSQNSQKLVLVKQAIEQLSDRERSVLFTTMEYDQPGKEHQRVPNSVMTDLANCLNTTSVNIRKIRERAKEKIRLHVEAGISAPARRAGQ
jgi:RNA polymerase sigma factor (sigma-70 family)